MEPHLLHILIAFTVGLVVGLIIMLLVNKLKSGSMTPSKVKQEYQDYQDKVEGHFEETSKKFKEMTEQYQDLYKHLSVGATTLCRPDSVAAVLADKSEPMVKLENKPSDVEKPKQATASSPKKQASDASTAAKKQEPSAKKQEPSAKDELSAAKSEPLTTKSEPTADKSKTSAVKSKSSANKPETESKK